MLKIVVSRMVLLSACTGPDRCDARSPSRAPSAPLFRMGGPGTGWGELLSLHLAQSTVVSSLPHSSLSSLPAMILKRLARRFQQPPADADQAQPAGAVAASPSTTAAQGSATDTQRAAAPGKASKPALSSFNSVRRRTQTQPASVEGGATTSPISDTPPRIDFQLPRGRSSPILVDAGGDGSSPWVDLASLDDDDASSSLGLGLGESTPPSRAMEARAGERPVNPKLQAVIDSAQLSVLQATVLVTACSKVLKEQGECIKTELQK